MTIIYRKCTVCGGGVEGGVQTTCYGCHLDSLIPGWYCGAEGYEYIPAYGHANATRKPMTGLAILDCPSGHRLSRFAPMGVVPASKP